MSAGTHHPQTKKGNAARGPTAEEFADFVSAVGDKYQELLVGAGMDPRRGWRWSWDNPRIHGSVENGDWEEYGITVDNHTMLPAYSPDMHSVIETSHAIIVDAFKAEVNARGQGLRFMDALRRLEAIFYEKLTPEWGVKAVKRLYAVTLPGILEAEGHYPPKRAR